MSDIGQWTCPRCGEKVSGVRVGDPGLPAAIDAHKAHCDADDARHRADELDRFGEQQERRATELRAEAGILCEGAEDVLFKPGDGRACPSCEPCRKWHGGKCCICKRPFTSA